MPEFTQRYKSMFGQIRKDLTKTGKGSTIVRGYFTSDNRDEVGDVITRQATEQAIPAYKQWGNIRLMHQPMPVGKITKIGVDDGLEWNELEAEIIEPHAVFLVDNGLVTAFSVGILVNYEDVEFEEDGGITINGYKLAEISIVDHPANYDAAMKDAGSAGDGLRVLARTYGFDAVASSMQELLERENKKMEDEKPIETPEEEAQEEPVAEEEAAVEEPVTEEPEAPAEEEEVEKAAEEEQPAVENAVKVLEMVVKLIEAVDALTKKIDEFLVTKAVDTTDQVQPELEQADRDAAEEDEKTVEPPVRKSEQPATEEAPQVEQKKAEKYAGLQAALWKHFETKAQ